MQKLSTLVISFLFFISFSNAQNLVMNPGFEDDPATYIVSNDLRRVENLTPTVTKSGNPTATAISVTGGMWVKKAANIGYIKGTPNSSNFNSGSYGILFRIVAGSTQTGLGSWNNAVMLQKIATGLSHTKKYVASVWAKADPSANNTCTQFVMYLSESTLKANYTATIPLTGGSTWTKYTATFDLPTWVSARPTADFSSAFFGIGIKTTYDDQSKTNYSGVYLDDFSLQELVEINSGSTAASSLDDNSIVAVASGAELSVGANKTLNSVSVAAGGKLTITAGALTATNGITLESDANGTATMLDIAPVSNTTVKQYLSSARNWYFTPAVSGVTVPSGSTYFGYDESGTNSDVGISGASEYWKPHAGGSQLVQGKGYIVQPGAATTISFTNTSNSGNINVALTNHPEAGKGYNLVGNPYPSYLSWSDVAADNTANGNPANMPTGTIWYRTVSYNEKSAWAPNTSYNLNDIVYNGTHFYKVTTAGTSDVSGGPTGGVGTTNITDGTVVWAYEGTVYVFATVNAAGVPTPATVSNLIPPMQAFWIKSNGGTLTFKNSMRSHNTGGSNLFKAPQSTTSDRQLVRLKVSNGASADEIVICTNENAANTLDAYDAPKYFNIEGSNQAELYTQSGSEKLAINSLNTLPIDTEIPLGFLTEKANLFKLKATELNNIPSGQRVILKDKANNTEFDLTDGSDYSFSSDAVNNASRFSLIFRAPRITTEFANLENENVSVYVNAQNHIVINATAGSKYSIYNAVGQQIESGVISTERETTNTKQIAAGFYVVKVNNQTKTVIIK